jgi:hypothetical protein
MDLNSLGRLVLLIGIALVVLGGMLIVFSRVPVLKHLGHLPGDIHLEGENYSCAFPLVSMLIISLLLSLALNLVIRLFNR